MYACMHVCMYACMHVKTKSQNVSLKSHNNDKKLKANWFR